MFSDWKILLTRKAESLIDDGSVPVSLVKETVTLALRKLAREDVNVDFKKVSGKWEGFYRIRIGTLRIICSFDFKSKIVKIERIDFRGNVYK